MKRTLSLLIASVVVVAFAAPSFAYPRPVEKLKDGVTTVIKSPLEVKDHVMSEAKDGSFLPFSLTGGLLKGGFYMTKKVVEGAIDIATFPIDR
jgi:hypothetical protein